MPTRREYDSEKEVLFFEKKQQKTAQRCEPFGEAIHLDFVWPRWIAARSEQRYAVFCFFFLKKEDFF